MKTGGGQGEAPQQVGIRVKREVGGERGGGVRETPGREV